MKHFHSFAISIRVSHFFFVFKNGPTLSHFHSGRIPRPQFVIRIRGALLWRLDQLAWTHLRQLPYVLRLHGSARWSRCFGMPKWFLLSLTHFKRRLNLLGNNQVACQRQVQLWICARRSPGRIYKWALPSIHLLLHIQRSRREARRTSRGEK